MTSLIEDKTVPVHGWDLPELKEQTDQLNERNAQFKRLGAILQKDLNNHQWESFFTPGAIFDKIVDFAPKKEQEEKANILKLLQGNNMPAFAQKLNCLLEAIAQAHAKSIDQLRRETFQARQKFLIHAIKQGIELGSTVLPHTGASHGIRNPRLPGEAYDLTEMNTFLKTQTFVMVLLKAI
ncbi:MAG: hypothetical protein ACRDFB_07845, partial [Rhabdochlamydiaceae bacterium]